MNRSLCVGDATRSATDAKFTTRIMKEYMSVLNFKKGDFKNEKRNFRQNLYCK